MTGRIAAIGVILTLSLLVGGCGPDQASPAAASFTKHNQAILGELSPSLAPLVAVENDAKIGQILEAYFRRSAGQGQRLGVGLLVLGTRGQVLGGRWPGLSEADELRQPETDYNYSQYKDIAKVLKKGRVTRSIFYTINHKVYMVCGPLKHHKNIVGALCVGHAPTDLDQAMKLGDEEFLALDFAD